MNIVQLRGYLKAAPVLTSERGLITLVTIDDWKSQRAEAAITFYHMVVTHPRFLKLLRQHGKKGAEIHVMGRLNVQFHVDNAEVQHRTTAVVVSDPRSFISFIPNKKEPCTPTHDSSQHFHVLPVTRRIVREKAR